jgi:hypothetical protein
MFIPIWIIVLIVLGVLFLTESGRDLLVVATVVVGIATLLVVMASTAASLQQSGEDNPMRWVIILPVALGTGGAFLWRVFQSKRPRRCILADGGVNSTLAQLVLERKKQCAAPELLLVVTPPDGPTAIQPVGKAVNARWLAEFFSTTYEPVRQQLGWFPMFKDVADRVAEVDPLLANATYRLLYKVDRPSI